MIPTARMGDACMHRTRNTTTRPAVTVTAKEGGPDLIALVR